MERRHHYLAKINWTGAQDAGTKNYKTYTRDYDVIVDGKQPIKGSSDPAFRGDPTRHNPEDILVASTSSCHMLWYLHLCSVNNIVVLAYSDNAEGVMIEGKGGSGFFEKITLNPHITITVDSDIEKAHALHNEANKMCFIANSLKCPVEHGATIEFSDA